MPDNVASPLMNLREAAQYLRIRERAMRSLRQRGEIPIVRVGHGRGRVFYRQADLDRYIEEHVEVPGRNGRRKNRRS